MIAGLDATWDLAKYFRIGVQRVQPGKRPNYASFSWKNPIKNRLYKKMLIYQRLISSLAHPLLLVRHWRESAPLVILRHVHKELSDAERFRSEEQRTCY